MSIEPRHYRNTIGLFATGVAVIAMQSGNEVHAMTANAVSSLSLDPMLVLFCPGKQSKLARHLPAMRAFTINILRDEQQALSTFFAGSWREPVAPPFRFVPFHDAPRLEGSLASLDCVTDRIIDGGDHWLIVGRVRALHRGIEPHRPLLFYNGSYRGVDFAAGSPAPDLSEVTDEPAHIFYDSGHG